jgi:hypothetical protein
VAALVLAAWPVPGLAAGTLLPLVEAGAKDAQARCFRLVHEDAFEFVACLDALVKDAGGETAPQAARRLGLQSS